MKKRILHLTVTRYWFGKLASGRKRWEFREDKEYWRKRLEGRSYDEVWIRCGYSSAAPVIKYNWEGCQHRTLRNKSFFAIDCHSMITILNYEPDNLQPELQQ